jgi:hypothetical protein
MVMSSSARPGVGVGDERRGEAQEERSPAFVLAQLEDAVVPNRSDRDRAARARPEGRIEVREEVPGLHDMGRECSQQTAEAQQPKRGRTEPPDPHGLDADLF